MKKLIVTGAVLVLFMVAPVMESEVVDSVMGVETAYAAESTFSEYWFQDIDGSWKVKDNNGNVVKNCWLCDDAVSSNGQNVWYLIDSNGNMVSAGLVRDSAGNYYSIETNHNGFYGMMRYQSGTYDGITLSLDGTHNGRFGAILNTDGINALQSKYGLTDISNISTACVYTSSFRNSGTSTNQSSSTVSSSEQSSQSPAVGGGVEGVDYVIINGIRIELGDSVGLVNDGADLSITWDAEAQDLAERVGEAMAH